MSVDENIRKCKYLVVVPKSSPMTSISDNMIYLKSRIEANNFNNYIQYLEKKRATGRVQYRLYVIYQGCTLRFYKGRIG